jgi:hypothetical protein
MNRQLLIDQIVRQTMILIAQLATTGGVRAPLAHLADRVFLELARELEAQGLSRKVSADMFGLALRSYRRRIQRSSESVTVRGRSLWAAVLDYIPSDRLVTRAEILQRFHLDEELQVRAILSDLCDSGLLLRLGRGPARAYRAATTEELAVLEANSDGLTHFLWLLIYREGPLTRSALLERARAEAPRVEEALERLRSSGRISLQGTAYSCSEVVVHQHEPAGWEAAMLDHFQALVKTLCSRLRGQGGPHASGGSTYSFDVAPEHPLAAEVYGQLQRLRNELSALRTRVEQHNASHPHDVSRELVTIYVGQHVQSERSDGDHAGDSVGNLVTENQSSPC